MLALLNLVLGFGVPLNTSNATCAATNAQCAGSGGSAMKPLGCCNKGDKCEPVNQYYSKCVYQPCLLYTSPSPRDS